MSLGVLWLWLDSVFKQLLVNAFGQGNYFLWGFLPNLWVGTQARGDSNQGLFADANAFFVNAADALWVNWGAVMLHDDSLTDWFVNLYKRVITLPETGQHGCEKWLRFESILPFLTAHGHDIYGSENGVEVDAIKAGL